MYICTKCEANRQALVDQGAPENSLPQVMYDKWANRCPACGNFNTLTLRTDDEDSEQKFTSWVETDTEAVLISSVEKKELPRISTNTREFDRVLGGGIVIGSTVLLGGEPGAGKSTLMIQTCGDLSTAETTDDEGKPSKIKVLYVSAEETKSQIKDRGDRVSTEFGEVYLYNQNDVYEIEKKLDEIDPDVLIIDSIQKMWKSDVQGPPGRVTQVQECAAYIVNITKARDIATFMIAHVTKDGDLAGPKVLEHLVDAVLVFGIEGALRVLRAEKNRFGSTDEMGIFKMTAKGLSSVENPSELLLEEHVDGVPGIAIGLAIDGSRTMGVEIQSLSRRAKYVGDERERRLDPKVFVTGLSKDRVNQLVAILEERLNVELDGDLHVNVAGGETAQCARKDSGCDLAIAVSVASSILGYALPESTCFVGEVGLAGEIRLVPFIESRIKAARLLGFETIIGPVIPSDEDGNRESDDYNEYATLDELFDDLDLQRVKKEVKKSKKVKKGDKKTKGRANVA